MNAETFFENFSLLSESPNGIQKLREMILQMAVRGKLVPQNPGDEPAEMLLERIYSEDKVKGCKGSISISMDEHPFGIPLTWKWVRFCQIVDFNIGRTPKTKVSEYWNEEGVPWVSIADMVNYGEITKTTKSISKKAVEEVFKNDPVPAGTILMSFKLTIGKISKLKVNAFHNEAIISIFPPYKELKEYLFRILPILATGGDTNNAIKGKTLNKNSLNNLLIPLPPLEEQKHIVTKVDQLMELCDHLESLEQKKHESHIHLNNTALNKMLDASSPEEFEENWRLVCDNFGLLYDNIENVEKLRQSILQLAVMGKLVEQDADDEPAEVLLEKIYAEKERLVKEKKIKKSKVSSKIEENEIPYQIPNNWKWTRADVVSKAIEYGTSHKASTNGSNVPVLRMNNINKGKISYENLKYVPDEIKDLPRLFLKTNDLLFNRTNSYELVGKTGIFKGNDDEYTFASYLIRMSLLDDCVNPDFINNAMNAEYYRKTQIEPEITQQCGQANFNGTKLKHSLIPLPPLEEQKRIVTRVDQLMELCDRLEAGIRQVQEDGEKLMEVAVSGLLASCD